MGVWFIAFQIITLGKLETESRLVKLEFLVVVKE